MVLLLISFIAGVLTVLAPCVLPLLPVIVGGSLVAEGNPASAQGSGRAKRAYAICIALGGSVLLFTLLLKVSTAFINIPQSFWEYFSGAILILFGIVLIFPQLWDSLGFVNLMNRSSNRALAAGYQRNSIWGDMLMGAALGPVFSSCSPTYFVILATVLPQSFAMGLVDLLAYVVGLSGFLFIISIAGQKLVDKLGLAIEPGGWFRRAIGVLFLIVGIGVATGIEANLEAWLLSNGFDVTVIEERLLGGNASGIQTHTAIQQMPGTASSTASSAFLTSEEKALTYQKPPELTGIDGYINTPGNQPITLAQYKGKNVVLVDFWTYSCINCQRTIPYLEAWYKKYAGEGLVIVGVSTPEFAFEHVYDNVANASKQLEITYPIVLDNEYATWNAFGNSFWPRDYLIDIDGYIVYDHAGEGDYDGAETAIQKALEERAARLGTSFASAKPMPTPSNAIPIDFTQVQSPETYFGSNRNEYLGNGSQGRVGVQTLSTPRSINANTLYLAGAWDFEPEFAQNQSGGAQITYQYAAKNVYFVAASGTGKPITVKVLLDGKPLDASMRGADVDSNSEVTVQADRLYDIVKGVNYAMHTIQITVENPGLQGYTFTFG